MLIFWKNGPARHLIDAISYVRDGGQYFSPQLRRDGLHRHLLEETPRRSEPSGQVQRDTRYGRSRRPPRRASDPQGLRERLSEDKEGENLEERDYEILSMMADGIRPILDRLDEIEGRVGEIETGDAPVLSNVRGWLSTQIAETFEGRALTQTDPGRTVNDLEARLPQLIEQAVTARFHDMAGKLQREVEETHVRALETFVRNIQVKLVQRVSALETDMSNQAEAMNQLRDYSLRTEDNLSRLITGVDKLAQELPNRVQSSEPPPAPSEPEPKAARRRSSRSVSPRSISPKIFWTSFVALLLIVVGAFQLPKLFRGSAGAASAKSGAVPGTVPGKPALPGAEADIKTKMLAAADYLERKDYAVAEDIYKQVLKADSSNVDALKALASVLYREDKIEESAAILDKLPRN